MNILLNDNHTPHQAMILRSMPDLRIHVLSWQSHFRDIEPNAVFISKKSAMTIEWDLVFDDDVSYTPSFEFKSRRRVLLHHCEHDDGSKVRHDALVRAVDKADIVAVPSKHKIASFRELGLSSKVVELPFGFERWDLDSSKRDPSLVGCFHNCPNDEIRAYWSACVEGFNSVMIGPVVSGPFPLGITNGFLSFEEQASRVGIYLNCVVGEAMGMAPMEAMAAGIPVVTACAPEPWEFIFSGWNGFLSRNEPMRSIDWIRDRIRFLIDNPAEAVRMGEAGRQTILRRFPLSKVAETFRTFLP
jgi:hypothetical protein